MIQVLLHIIIRTYELTIYFIKQEKMCEQYSAHQLANFVSPVHHQIFSQVMYRSLNLVQVRPGRLLRRSRKYLLTTVIQF